MEKKEIYIIAIESSCDETSVAVVKNGNDILSNIVASQINSHKRFGGVVPEVASRHHVEQIIQCMSLAIDEANITVSDLSAVAVTYGPGLVGSLLIGITAAKSFAWANDLPLIPVNHMAGHIYAARFVEEMTFPLMALLVSGGHTELVYMTEHGEFEVIGETRDDAAGEAYDKVGRVLGLTYPSGKEIDELAHKGQDNYHFPRGMIKEDNFDFSFSGLKSSVINLVHNAKQRDEVLCDVDLAASFQQSVIDVLVDKTIRACKVYDVKQLIVAGGVAANKGLRDTLKIELAKELPNVTLVVPPISLCGDNAAMIGAAGFVEYQKQHVSDWHLNAKPSLTL
ncbi:MULTISPECIES: tRNA (adenosine(37)-N6)-threonylcarbamoyltransferase complex transferase subunit TsaD [Enterococcaceae]|uniref:tRNA (adenosine(37)-N6)-threonylcarbamoyltransferase complex transferase subunit TsaD n=1 Tax=Enterococcaceae TaxID=81852 RepID=UPI000E4AFD58|nr:MULTISPECIES: tRNA (adenosine(37)-N6)-threonylcarbamoyltransferase complex transferase subunit TsaD [Enterococcaceae]RGI30838.1 tRNA (adenosine(37)-N6)-threonylcarbamoyltransferase complex transferase subunit TsaD [Melissococcus sp. OM08-11BH]UNM88816.1 tRNA (adenosine(37)-N6)-threonylcarbamoyltransferase complex transferase subunit TsaD [Vagococcus sp. CY52-2]